MVWARPGEGISGREALDVWDPKNWLLDGKTPDKVDFDENTDLVLPDSDTDYFMDFHRVEGWDPVYRNVTVGRNARMLHESARYFGNVWIKKGGQLDGRHGNIFQGASTFLRNDNRVYDDLRSGLIGQYLRVAKEPDAALEVITGAAVFDRVIITLYSTIFMPAVCL